MGACVFHLVIQVRGCICLIISIFIHLFIWGDAHQSKETESKNVNGQKLFVVFEMEWKYVLCILIRNIIGLITWAINKPTAHHIVVDYNPH